MQTPSVKLLLVYPDFTESDTPRKHSGGNYSEGLASISAVLKKAGVGVSLLHLLYEHDKEQFLEKLKGYDFDLIGFSVRTTAFEYVKKLAGWAKEATGKFLFCGGYHPTLVPDEVLAADGVDAVCIGEGEYPVLELCQRFWQKDEDFYRIQSFHFKTPEGGVIRNPVRPMLENLDELPIPDFDLFDFDNLTSSKTGSALVMMSRGCLFSCTYCGNSQFRNVYPNRKRYARFRSFENSLLYLKTLLKKHPYIQFLNFRDAIFNMYDDWFYGFMEVYKKEIGLPFTCNLRLDIMTEETVRVMKEAGCYLIDVGVESGDEEIRHKYLKRMMTDEQMIHAFSWFHKYGITSLTYNIVGLPFEDLHKALKTIKLNVKLNPDKVIPNIFYPYPMTILADIARKAGFVPDVIEPGTKVPLKQEQFPEHEVLFASYYFLTFLRLYRFAGKLPGALGRGFSRMCDGVFVGRLTPRKALVKLYEGADRCNKGLRRTVSKRLPGVYMWLRRRRNKIAAA